MKDEAEQAIQASIEIRYDGDQVTITKKNLNNVVALGVLELARGILMKETLGVTRQLAGGQVVAGQVPFRPPKLGS